MYQGFRVCAVVALLSLVACLGAPPPYLGRSPYVPVDLPISSIEGLSIIVSSLSFEGRAVRQALIYLDVPSSDEECPKLESPVNWYVRVQEKRFPMQSIGGVVYHDAERVSAGFSPDPAGEYWSCSPIYGSIPHSVSADTREALVIGVEHHDSSITMEVDNIFRVRRWTWLGPAQIRPGEMSVVQYDGPTTDSFVEPFLHAWAAPSFWPEPQDHPTWNVVDLGSGRFGLVAPPTTHFGNYSVSGSVGVGLDAACRPENSCSTSFLQPPNSTQIVDVVDFSYSITVVE
jgi:hypothetical protein